MLELRTNRLVEESMKLLKEEMRRSYRYFEYHRQKWLAKAQDQEDVGSSGAAAYSRKYVYVGLASQLDADKDRHVHRQANRYARLIKQAEREFKGRVDVVSNILMQTTCVIHGSSG